MAAIELLTPDEAALILKRKPDTLRQWRYKRKGPPFRDVCGRPMYERAKLMEWIEARPQTQFPQAG